MLQDEIVDSLKSRITGGEFSPGTALPLRGVLLKEYKISVATFQKCINRLSAEGFLESKGIKGTFVQKHPPYCSHFALVFPEKPDRKEPSDTFFKALREAAPDFASRTPGRSIEFYGIPESGGEMTGVEPKRLLADTRNRMLAGIIFVNFVPSQEFQKELGSCPVCVISRSPKDSFHNYPVLRFDTTMLLSQCMDSLRRRGGKRSAVLVFQHSSPEELLRMEKFLPPDHQEWLVGLDHIHGRELLNRNILKLLLQKNGKERPDSLAVLNENFMPLLMETLTELELQPGKDIILASHSNYPVVRRLYQNVEYFAYSSYDVLEKAFSLLSNHFSIQNLKPRELMEIRKESGTELSNKQYKHKKEESFENE